MFFIFICLMVYESNLKHYYRDLESLQSKINGLESEKHEAEKVNASLKLMVKSINDPAWVNLVLIEELGLIPEEQRKIIIKTVEGH